jgi:hypothetical protein
MPASDATSLNLQPSVPNMHSVVAREIKPRTKPHGCSFARMLNPEGLEITAFVTHTWEERFDHFVGTLEMALGPKEVVWVCSCALDQNADIKQLLDSDDLLLSPFAKALRHAPKLVVTLDEELKVPERSWCAFELEKASQWAIPTFMWPYHMTSLKDLEEKVNSLDIRRASATAKVDQARIHKAIQEGIGYATMNQRLRAFLGDRLRFYEAAVSKHVGQLAALTQDIDEARRQHDVSRLAILEAEKLSQQRLMQLEMERTAAQEASVAAWQIEQRARTWEEDCSQQLQQQQEREEQWHRRVQRLELDLEEARLEKAQAEKAVLQAKAEAQALASWPRQTQESTPGACLSQTLVTYWPLVAVRTPVKMVQATRLAYAGHRVLVQQRGPPRVDPICLTSQAVTVSHLYGGARVNGFGG